MEEVEYFLDINSNQKGVPKTLRIELSKFLSEPDSIDDIRNNLFKSFNENIESPLFDKMTSHQSIVGKISNVAFKESLDPVLNLTFVSSLSFEEKERLLLNFLRAISNVLIEIEGNTKRLTTSVFFPAIFKNFELFMNYSRIRFNNLKEESFFYIMENVFEKIDLGKYTGSSGKTKLELTTEIKETIELSLTEYNNSNPVEL